MNRPKKNMDLCTSQLIFFKLIILLFRANVKSPCWENLRRLKTVDDMFFEYSWNEIFATSGQYSFNCGLRSVHSINPSFVSKLHSKLCSYIVVVSCLQNVHTTQLWISGCLHSAQMHRYGGANVFLALSIPCICQSHTRDDNG